MKLLKRFALLLVMGTAAVVQATPLLGESVPDEYWTGTRSIGSGVYGAGGWSSLFTIDYDIEPRDGAFHYEYTLTFANKDLSSFTIGVTPGCENDPWCITNSSPGDPDIRLYEAFAPPLFYLPLNFFGAKLDAGGTGASPQVFSFYSNREPVWSGFYAKDGTGTYAFSTSFTYPDSCSIVDFLPGPDGEVILEPASIPEPSTLLLLGGGMLALASFRRRRPLT